MHSCSHRMIACMSCSNQAYKVLMGSNKKLSMGIRAHPDTGAIDTEGIAASVVVHRLPMGPKYGRTINCPVWGCGCDQLRTQSSVSNNLSSPGWHSSSINCQYGLLIRSYPLDRLISSTYFRINFSFTLVLHKTGAYWLYHQLPLEI